MHLEIGDGCPPYEVIIMAAAPILYTIDRCSRGVVWRSLRLAADVTSCFVSPQRADHKWTSLL